MSDPVTLSIGVVAFYAAARSTKEWPLTAVFYGCWFGYVVLFVRALAVGVA